MIRKYIEVSGLVQGVGFRPFVYRIALQNHLKGFIKNSSIGVVIDIEGEENDISAFLDSLQYNGPSLSKIENISIKNMEITNYKTFDIRKSSKENQGFTFISPDLGMCEDCYRDAMDKQDKRYLYAFTNCTNCGPRYSIVKKLPYDRASTTMKSFNMCKPCSLEYSNPLNRRFHAQPNCCPQCGPRLELYDNQGMLLEGVDEIKETIELLKSGNIFSIKGIGGFHLGCDGKNNNAIEKLRNRKHRPSKPFALMMRNIETVKKYCVLSPKEEEILCSNKRPIVILDKRNETDLPNSIAPDNMTLGVMLPYTPLHYFLFDDELDVLVMTSANINGMPIIFENEESIEKLKGIVDYHLMNNREIYTSIDDSVVRVILEETRIIRRGRGYSPAYFKGNGFKESLSMGTHFKNTFCLCKDENIILSQYIGDLNNEETRIRERKAIKNLRDIYSIDPEFIACDMHPDIFSSEILKEEKTHPIYHHHAHIASVLFENNLKERVIGVAYDGTGYGEDGTIWGGEFLICNLKGFKRVAHLKASAMPGGDKASIEPRRMGISYLYDTFNEDIEKVWPLDKKDKLYIEMIKKDINCHKTSSIGRFFDGAAWLLGFNRKVTFEGEAAIYLENMADKNETCSYEISIDYKDKEYVIETKGVIKAMINDILTNTPREIIAKRFHNTIINFTVKICSMIREKYALEKVALSGGAFQNKILLEGIYSGLVANGFKVYTNKEAPCNDGGVSLGQIAISNEWEMN